MPVGRETRSGMVHYVGGCYQCHGNGPGWFAKNVVGVAARHHDATGHTTWTEVAIRTRFGPDLNAAARERGQQDLVDTDGQRIAA